jgi:phage terminase small subunit
MAEGLTHKQKLFVEAFLATGNATESARLAGYKGNDVTLGAVGAENLKKPQIQDFLIDKAQRAAEIVFQIAEHGESDQVRLSASKDILDRAGYKAVEKHLNVNMEVKEISPRLQKLAKKLNG